MLLCAAVCCARRLPLFVPRNTTKHNSTHTTPLLPPNTSWFPFTILKAWGACICTQEIPQAEAVIDKSKCEAKDSNAVPVYYNHRYANVKACRIVNVPMEKSSFRWAYNEVLLLCLFWEGFRVLRVGFWLLLHVAAAAKQKPSPPPSKHTQPQHLTSFANGRMMLKMEGSNGERLYYPTAMEFGFAEVTAKVSTTSGVVSAWYMRSDTQQETNDFSEIGESFCVVGGGARVRDDGGVSRV